MNRLTWTAFQSPVIRTVSLVIVAILLLGSFLGVWRTFSTTTEREEQVTLLTYEHKGEFDHQVYAKPGTISSSGADQETSRVYFTNIIESMDVSFSYHFESPEPLTQVSEEVEISAVLQSEGLWQHEIILIPKTTKTGDFTITFPLKSTQFRDVSRQISKEIGTGSVSPDVFIKATVHTVAQTDSGLLEDDFVQTARVKLLGIATVEWDKDLALSQGILHQGSRYEHQGIFDYAIKLKPNILFGPVTMRANTPPPGPPVVMAQSNSYPLANIDSMEATFSYRFESDQPLQQISTYVEVEALLEDPGNWSETFDLVPQRENSGNFTITFPLDITHYYEVISAKQRELVVYSPSHDLVLQAEVLYTARTDSSPVHGVFSQSVIMNLSQSSVGWPGETAMADPGSITEIVTVHNSVWPARGGAIAGLLLVVLLGYYVVWNYTHVRPITLSEVEAEARRVKRKHKDVIVDVEDLPEAVASEMVVSLSSLEELVKTADALLKPVLHKADLEKHTYQIIDGIITYEYVSAVRLTPDQKAE